MAEEKNLDPSTQEFIRILSGQDKEINFTNPQAWREKLVSILKETNWKSLQPKELPFYLSLERGYKLNVSIEGKIQNTYRAFTKFRFENLKSKWFVETSLPEYLDEIVRSLEAFPSQICKSPEPQNIREIFKQAEIDRAEERAEAVALAKQNADLRANTSVDDPYADWKKDWNPKKAAEFAAYLWDHPEKMPALHLVSREDSLLSPPQADPDRKNLTNVRRIIFHHSDTGRNATVRDIQRSHFNRYFSDIGYHFAIGQDPKTKEVVVFQGRDLGTQGAHAKNNNSDSIGIVFIGNFEPYDSMLNPTGVKTNASDHSTDPVLAPSLEQIAAGTALAYQLDHLGSAVMKIANDKGVNIQLERIQGHGDCAATEKGTHTLCPGEGLKPFVKAMDAKVKEESAKAENQR
ncbi:MAG: N-acetylmuramoyl-L-alanine amidase [Deltaproteobacteria bacterium]|nr:N-acetylmuramoyl-L-alanine amidase [Deltaproteobacteria bacterium]